jgi:hypothetical protein
MPIKIRGNCLMENNEDKKSHDTVPLIDTKGEKDA